MKIEDVAWVLPWDYEAWLEYPNKSPYLQKDWNQTLITRINQCSAQIHKTSLRGGADTLFMNDNVLKIVETFEYYDIINKKIGESYQIVIDNSITEDIIFISNEKAIKSEIIPKTKEGEKIIHENGDIETIFDEVDFLPKALFSDDEIKDYRKRLKGCIPIKNYKATI
jgi:hypothetical protein